MEEEAEKLKEMQNEVEKQMNMSPPPGNGKNLNCTFKSLLFDLSIECHLLVAKLQLPISCFFEKYAPCSARTMNLLVLIQTTCDAITCIVATEKSLLLSIHHIELPGARSTVVMKKK